MTKILNHNKYLFIQTFFNTSIKSLKFYYKTINIYTRKKLLNLIKNKY